MNLPACDGSGSRLSDSQVAVHECPELLLVDGFDVWHLVTGLVLQDQRARAHLGGLLGLEAKRVLVAPNVARGNLQARLEHVLKSEVSRPESRNQNGELQGRVVLQELAVLLLRCHQETHAGALRKAQQAVKGPLLVEGVLDVLQTLVETDITDTGFHVLYLLKPLALGIVGEVLLDDRRHWRDGVERPRQEYKLARILQMLEPVCHGELLLQYRRAVFIPVQAKDARLLRRSHLTGTRVRRRRGTCCCTSPRRRVVLRRGQRLCLWRGRQQRSLHLR